MVPISEIIHDKPNMMESEQTLSELLSLWREEGISPVAVLEKGKLIGVLSENLFMTLMEASDPSWELCPGSAGYQNRAGLYTAG